MSGICSSDGCYNYNCHCMYSRWKNCSNTVTIPGNSVNINIDCLASNDRLEYHWLKQSLFGIMSSTDRINRISFLSCCKLKRTNSSQHIVVPHFPKYYNVSLTVWSMNRYCSIYIKRRSRILFDISRKLKLAKINPVNQTLVSTIKWIVACTEGQILA